MNKQINKTQINKQTKKSKPHRFLDHSCIKCCENNVIGAKLPREVMLGREICSPIAQT